MAHEQIHKNVIDHFDGVDKEKMTKEFAIALHNTLGELLLQAMKEGSPPCAILMTSGGMAVLGVESDLVALLAQMHHHPDLQLMNMKAMVALLGVENKSDG